MKYFLALDKGSLRKANDRFTMLDLSIINPSLAKDNNLRSLAEFTCSFNTSSELKYFLIQKGILNSKLSYFDLVICYEYSGIKMISVAYKCDAEYIGINNEYLDNNKNYIDISRLKAIIFDKAKNDVFLENLLHYYRNYTFLAEEIRLIKAYSKDPFATLKFSDAIRKFVEKICKNGNTIDFRRVYDLGILVSKLTNKGRDALISRNLENKDVSKSKSVVEMDEVLKFELEQLEDRLKKGEDDDGQLTMF